MSRKKVELEEPEQGINSFSLVEFENIIRNIIKVNYDRYGIKQYKLKVSPDGTRIIINAVIDTPFPEFGGDGSE